MAGSLGQFRNTFPCSKSTDLAGLETQNAAFFERKRPKRKPWHRGKSLNRKKNDRNAFLNASVLLRKALNLNLSWGFPLGNLLPKTCVLKHRVLERKRRPNANASVPKGPFRTKNAMALESVLFCYCRSLLLSVPFSAPFS